MGRGIHFRSSDSANIRFTGGKVGCYYNPQRFGSVQYQRLSEYLGPQYDIQYGFNHQGYGRLYPNGTKYYDGFFGQGSLYIDLPHARKFEASFNCTKGFQLMNESNVLLNSAGLKTLVYTDKDSDPKGNGVSRAIYLGQDQFYPGTCEADIVCGVAVGIDEITQMLPCPEGYIW